MLFISCLKEATARLCDAVGEEVVDQRIQALKSLSFPTIARGQKPKLPYAIPLGQASLYPAPNLALNRSIKCAYALTHYPFLRRVLRRRHQ